MRRRCASLTLVLLAVMTVVFEGCGKPSLPGADARAATSPPAAAAPGRPADVAPSEQALTPPGIIVCEPIPTGASAEVVRFADACARWLHLTVAGLPECSRSCAWVSVSRVARQLKLPNVRMNLQQARKAARPLGVGAVAIGSVRQNGSQCTLEWKVYDVGSGAQIGATPKISGSREQLRKGLPGAARALARTLNLPVAALPSSVELSVDDLTVIGGTGWSQAEELPAATYRRLKQLAARSPLAVVHVAQNVMWQEPMEYSIFAAKAEATAKGNTLAIGELVRVDPAGDLGFLAEIEKLVARYPGNYVLGKASARFARGLESTFDAVALAEAGTRNAPGNADAWLALSQALLNKAQSFRKGVYFNQMTEEQISAVVPLYERAVAAAERAVERDPLWPLTWNELSVAAAFASDSRADKAYRKALALDPDDQDILWWGLELYQPKWLDDPEMLRKVAAIAASKDYRWPQWNYRLSQSLLRAGFKREAQVMLQRALASNKRYVERHPNDLTLRLEFARALKRYGRPAEARVQEQAAERIARERGIHLVGKPSP